MVLGIGDNWTPAKLLAGGKAGGFWDAADAEKATGAQLTDKCGNGNHLSQATAANQPSIVTVNGKRALRFDGSDYMLGLFTVPQPFTVAFAVGGISAGVSGRIIGRANATVAQLVVYFTGGGSRVYAGTAATLVNFPTSAPGVVVATCNGASSIAHRDGGGGVSGDTGTASALGVALGAEHDGTSGLAMDFYSGVIVAGALGASDRHSLEAWMMRRAGVKL